jgi:tetratricopeptide (TPR) repeat protein
VPNPPLKHAWIYGPRRAGRLAAFAALSDYDAVVDSDRRRRGPYTGVGSMLRTLVPAAHEAAPGLVARHRIEILCAAPELERLVGPAPGTLTSLAPPPERTRWYSALRTRRIAHGLVDFLRDYAALRPGGRLALGFDQLTEADPTDREFIAIALRRLPASRVLVVVGTGESEPPAELADALRTYARRRSAASVTAAAAAPPEPPAEPPEPASAGPATERAAADPAGDGDPAAGGGAAGSGGAAGDGGEAPAVRYLASDGTSDVPAERAAYLRLAPRRRAELHDARATELAAAGEFSLGLGALVYHRCRGTDPAGAGYRTGLAALEYCLGMGYYDAVLELAGRLLTLAEQPPGQLAAERSMLLLATIQALIVAQRADEAEPLLWGLLADTDNPNLQKVLHYQLGMLYTRHFGDPRKDHQRAKAHLNTAVAISSQFADPAERGFHVVFMRNGLALAEMHLGNLQRSYELVSAGLARLDRDLPPDRHLLHRSVLVHNRAQVLAGLGRTAEALADFDRVIELDPHYAEYHFDRGNVRARAGDPAGAIADYEHAMTLTPPFPELAYNRGDARLALGDADGAAADFRYVLDLEPDHLEARISLATLLLDAAEPVAAADQVRAGLLHAPENARLLCLLGRAAADGGDAPCALVALDRALAADPSLYQALVCRAELAYGQGRFDDAVRDLDRALELAGADPDVLFNRGYAHEAAGRPMAAIADYELALALPGADRAELLARRDGCLAAVDGPGAAEPAAADLAVH